MCLNVVHGIIVAATWRGDQREGDPLGVICHSRDRKHEARAMATVSSAVVKSKIKCKIGQACLTQCHTHGAYSSILMKHGIKGNM